MPKYTVSMLDMESYARKEHFRYFKGLAYPYAGLTVNVDVTDFVEDTQKKGQPFFLTFLYHVACAANSVPELRRRIQGEGIAEYSRCGTSHTVALENGTFCYCRLDNDMPLSEFLPYAKAEQQAVQSAPSIEEAGDPLSVFFVSCVPWLSYTALLQPTPSPADSNPRITWGRYFLQEGRTLMPVSLLCHHALADGLHMAAFYQELSRRISP